MGPRYLMAKLNQGVWVLVFGACWIRNGLHDPYDDIL